MAAGSSRQWTRWLAIILLIAFGLALALGGLLVPAHLKAIDSTVVAETGRGTTSLVDEGIALRVAGHIGQSRLFLLASRQCGVNGTEGLERTLAADAVWQSTNRPVSELELMISDHPWALKWDGPPVMKVLASRESRRTLHTHLQASVRSAALELLRTLDLTNLVYFAPAHAVSGQPFEAATLLASLLVGQDRIPAGLREAIESRAYGATRKGETQALELFYLDLVSLGNRMNWGQLIDLMNSVPNLETLKNLANLARQKSADWPVLYAAAHLQGSAADVTAYLYKHAKHGMEDLKFGLSHGRGALGRLLSSGRRIDYSPARDTLVEYDPAYTVFLTLVRLAKDSLSLALALKYLLLLGGSFLMARALIDLLPVADGIAVNRWLSPAHLALAATLVILAGTLTEPYLLQQNQTLSFPLHWKFPMVGGAVQKTITNALNPMMDQLTIVSLVVFLTLQATIYVVCLLKLSEIRRASVTSKIKLKLLENEEHMFDLGLYCGLFGSVLSFGFLALGILKPSLMAAYSSTLFGILFVAVLRVFHLRPLKRKLILESESQGT